MAIYESQFPAIEVPEVELTPHIFAASDQYLERTAIVDTMSGLLLTYGELRSAIARFAGGLQSRGFEPGDVLAVMAPNIAEYPVAIHGTLTAGGTATTVNPLYTQDELKTQLHDSGASVLFAHAFFAEMATSIASAIGIQTVIICGGEAEGTVPYEELLTASAYEGHAEVDLARNVALLPYSSGTTGLPKGVMLSHRNMVANTEQCRVAMNEEPEAIISVLPFFHIYGLQILLNGSFVTGKTVVTLPRFDLESFLQQIQEHQAKTLYVVPPIILALAKHPIVDQYDLSSLERIFSGAAPLGEDLAEQAQQRLGVEVVQGYGMTELSPVSHISPPGFAKPGSIGKLVSGAQCRIVDPETKQDVPAGETGEIWLRGDMVMLGYFNRPEATAETIDSQGWLHTGDIGYIDEEGDYYITDRLKELIKYKGFQVPPAELEALLLTHPAIADAGVIGLPDEDAGEIPKAFVVLKPDVAITPEQIMAFVAEQVSHYKQIRAVELVDEIPKSASGKILRRFLRERG